MGYSALKYLSVLACTSFIGGGCSDTDKSNQGYRVKTELLRMQGGTFLRSSSPGLNVVADPNRYAWTSNIDIKSLKLPIRSITLSELTFGSNTQNPQTIYSCETNCDVDLMGPELANLLGANETTITGIGSFQQISVGFGDGTWTGKIKAEFVLGGQTYYTKSVGAPTTVAPAEESSYSGFGGGSVSYLPEPLVFTAQEGETPSEALPLTVKLFFDPLFVATAIDGAKVQPTAYAGGFCVGDANTAEVRLCTTRLVITASTQDTAPTLERYLLNDASLVSLYFDNNTSPLGGSLRSVLNEGYADRGTVGEVDLTVTGSDSANTKNWSAGPIFGFTKNADDTYVISTTTGDPSPSNEDGGFRAKVFKRAAHTAKFETGRGNEYDYTATSL